MDYKKNIISSGFMIGIHLFIHSINFYLLCTRCQLLYSVLHILISTFGKGLCQKLLSGKSRLETNGKESFIPWQDSLIPSLFFL